MKQVQEALNTLEDLYIEEQIVDEYFRDEVGGNTIEQPEPEDSLALYAKWKRLIEASGLQSLHSYAQTQRSLLSERHREREREREQRGRLERVVSEELSEREMLKHTIVIQSETTVVVSDRCASEENEFYEAKSSFEMDPKAARVDGTSEAKAG